MTTVCAVARNGTVVMAADSMTTVYDRPIYGARKIIQLAVADARNDFDNSTLLIGCSGDGAYAGLLRNGHYHVDAIPDPDVDAQPWATAVAQGITELGIEHGLTDDGRLDAHLLLGWRGQLWTLVHQQAIYHPDGIAAIGSGEGPAIGAIDYALATGYADDLPGLLTAAVTIGIRRDRYSGGTIYAESIG